MSILSITPIAIFDSGVVDVYALDGRPHGFHVSKSRGRVSDRRRPFLRSKDDGRFVVESVETQTSGTKVPSPNSVPAKGTVTWRERLFPPSLAPLPLTCGDPTTLTLQHHLVRRCITSNSWGQSWPHGFYYDIWSGCYDQFLHQAKTSFQELVWSELIGVFDKISDVLWMRQFLEAQGYKINTNIVYQDNMSTLSLAKNGYISSSKRTKHIKAKYFFICHYHNAGELDLQYCPTEQMWADVLTKPLQGLKFRIMRAFLMNCPIDYTDTPDTLPSSKPTLSKKSSPTSSSSSLRFSPSDQPPITPLKNRSLQSNSSPRGCVETQTHGTKVPVTQMHTNMHLKDGTWRDTLFPRRLPTSSPLVSSERQLIN